MFSQIDSTPAASPAYYLYTLPHNGHRNEAKRHIQASHLEQDKHLASYAVVQPPKETDVFRDTLLRYVGFTNEVGEAFKNVIGPNLYKSSYLVSGAYALSDAIYKAKQAYDNCTENHSERHKHPFLSATAALVDVTVFHVLGTIVIPGKIIGALHKFVKNRVPKHLAKKTVGKSIPIMASIAAIPIIVRPLDHAVNFALDALLRPKIGRKPEVKGVSHEQLGALELMPVSGAPQPTPAETADTIYAHFKSTPHRSGYKFDYHPMQQVWMAHQVFKGTDCKHEFDGAPMRQNLKIPSHMALHLSDNLPTGVQQFKQVAMPLPMPQPPQPVSLKEAKPVYHGVFR